MQRAHRRWHLRIWTAMALLLPAVLATAALVRVRQHQSDAPIRIDGPQQGPTR